MKKSEVAVSGYMIPADLKNGEDYWLRQTPTERVWFWNGGGLRVRRATSVEIEEIRRDCGSNWPF